MQWAARSEPHQRRRSPRRPSTSFEPTESVDAASRRRSSIAKSPANAPNVPVTPGVAVDATAARSRSTIASAVASETPAAAYVCSGEDTPPSLAITSEAVTVWHDCADDRRRGAALARRLRRCLVELRRRRRSRRSSPPTARIATTRSRSRSSARPRSRPIGCRTATSPARGRRTTGRSSSRATVPSRSARRATRESTAAMRTRTCSSSPPTAAAARSPSGSFSSARARPAESGADRLEPQLRPAAGGHARRVVPREARTADRALGQPGRRLHPVE